MKLYAHIIALVILTCSYTSVYPVIEIHSIKEVLPYVPKNKRTLVVLDIDNTLMRPATHLGSDEWFSHLVQEKVAQGMDTISAIRNVLPLYFHIHFIIDLVPTEPHLHEEITRIACRCEHIVCLTSRSPNIVQRTVMQLAKNKLHFYMPEHQERVVNCLYLNGVIFCGNTDKGQVLCTFLDDIAYVPEVIIFVDDKEKYIHAVEAAAQKRNISCIGLRYAGCDHHVKNFDSHATYKELQEFLAQHPFNG